MLDGKNDIEGVAIVEWIYYIRIWLRMHVSVSKSEYVMYYDYTPKGFIL